MTYSLQEIIKRANPNRKAPVALRDLNTTKAQQAELAKIYLRVVRLWRQAGSELLEAYNPTPLVIDTQEETEAILARYGAVEATVLLAASRDIEDWIERLRRWHDIRWVSLVESASGVNVSSLIQDQAIREDLESALRRNVTLIRSVSDQTRERIAQAVWNGWLNRTPRREIAREIAKAIGMGRARALRIAIDQTVKLSGTLDRDRMLEAGIDAFKWRHSGKIHYRPDHKARDGKVFKWSSHIARTDPPSYAPFCGCKAQAWISLQDG